MSQKLLEGTRGDTTKGEWLIVMGSSSICTEDKLKGINLEGKALQEINSCFSRIGKYKGNKREEANPSIKTTNRISDSLRSEFPKGIFPRGWTDSPKKFADPTFSADWSINDNYTGLSLLRNVHLCSWQWQLGIDLAVDDFLILLPYVLPSFWIEKMKYVNLKKKRTN